MQHGLAMISQVMCLGALEEDTETEPREESGLGREET